jgi:hypothetical protein
MARLVSLTTLTARVKQRANVEVASNSALYSAAELTDNINEGLAKLYDLIIAQQDQPYYLSSVNFNTVNGTEVYKIGAGQLINVSDFYKGKGLDVTFGQQIVISARPFMWSERNRFKWYPGWIYSQPVFYQFTGKASGAVANAGTDSIKLIPMPNGQFNCTLWYYPVLAPLVSGADQFDGINGFEEYAVLDAAIKILIKQERFDHANLLMGRQQQEEARIMSMLVTHDAENPQRVQDVTLNDGWIGRPGY